MVEGNLTEELLTIRFVKTFSMFIIRLGILNSEDKEEEGKGREECVCYYSVKMKTDTDTQHETQTLTPSKHCPSRN